MNLQDRTTYEGLTLNKFEKVLPQVGSKLKLHLLDQKHKSNDHVDIIKNIYDAVVENVTFENQQSFNMPRMPYIYAKSNELLKDKYDYSELKGISGSIVFDEKNNIMGIISSITDEGLLSIVPSVTICRFIEEFIETHIFNGLCDIISKLALCCIDIGQCDGRESKFSYLVEDNYGINYNTYTTMAYKGTIRSNLKDGDLICKINNNTFDSDGYVYYDQTDCRVPLSTYVALNYKCSESIPLTILRNNNKKEGYAEKNININSRPVWTTKYIADVFSNYYYNYNGLIFMELTEELIDHYDNHSIILVGSIEKYYQIRPYRNSNDKVIVLVDIIRNNMSDNENSTFDEIGLPLINIDNKNNTYSLLVLKKINGKKVPTMRELKYLLNDNPKKTNILFEQSENIKISLSYIENKFDSMKYIKKD